MNEHASKVPPSWYRTILWMIGVVIICVISVIAFPGESTEQLLLGWIYFPLRTMPQVTIDWPTAFLGSVSSLMFVAGLHRMMRWVWATIPPVGEVAVSRWTWRSSLVVSSMLFVLFASGTAIVGATHQFIWLVSGRSDTGSEAVTLHDLGLIAQMRDAARFTQAKYELKMFGLAFHNFQDTYGAFPPGGTMNEDGELLHGWAAFLGPYHSYATDNIQFQLPWNMPPNDRVYKCQLHDFLNPSQPGPVFDANGYGLCHWAGNVHVLPVVTAPYNSLRPADGSSGFTTELAKTGQVLSLGQITDGASNTILIGSAGEQFKPWGHPANVRDPALGINRSPAGFGGPPQWHAGMFAMCDGSVTLLSEKTDLTIMKALATPSGSESLPDDFGKTQRR